MSEEWAEIPGFPGYRVSSLGRVLGVQGSIMRTGDDRDGYPHVTLRYGDGATRRSRKVAVHRMVLLAFRGDPPTGRNHGAHLDGNRHHNHLANLAWLSCAENDAHKDLHGTRPIGERHGRSRLTDDDVRNIRLALSNGGTNTRLAEEMGVSASTIQRVRSGENWGHVDA